MTSSIRSSTPASSVISPTWQTQQSDNQNSIIDLTRANGIETLTVTEGLFQGLQDGSGGASVRVLISFSAR